MVGRRCGDQIHTGEMYVATRGAIIFGVMKVKGVKGCKVMIKECSRQPCSPYHDSLLYWAQIDQKFR